MRWHRPPLNVFPPRKPQLPPALQSPHMDREFRSGVQLDPVGWAGREELSLLLAKPQMAVNASTLNIHRSFTSLCSQHQIYEQEKRKKGFSFKLLSLKWVSLYIKKLPSPCGSSGFCSWGHKFVCVGRRLIGEFSSIFRWTGSCKHYTSIYLILKEYKTMDHK